MPSRTVPTIARSRRQIHEASTAGQRIADGVASIMGSWRFIIIQTAIVVVWIALNVWLLSRPFDPYPLILLNLLFSTQAAYAAPVIMMSQNRQAAKDRARDDLEAREVASLVRMNEQQLEILRLLHQLANNSQTPPSPQQSVARRAEKPVTPRTPSYTSRRSAKATPAPAQPRTRANTRRAKGATTP